MDVKIIVALIGAIGVILAAVITGIFTARKHRGESPIHLNRIKQDAKNGGINISTIGNRNSTTVTTMDKKEE